MRGIIGGYQMIQPRKIEIQDFKDDLRFIIRKLRDMRADSELFGFTANDDLIAAQASLSNLLKRMDGEDEVEEP